jgi:hypothetical protein
VFLEFDESDVRKMDVEAIGVMINRDCSELSKKRCETRRAVFEKQLEYVVSCPRCDTLIAVGTMLPEEIKVQIHLMVPAVQKDAESSTLLESKKAAMSKRAKKLLIVR